MSAKKLISNERDDFSATQWFDVGKRTSLQKTLHEKSEKNCLLFFFRPLRTSHVWLFSFSGFFLRCVRSCRWRSLLKFTSATSLTLVYLCLFRCQRRSWHTCTTNWSRFLSIREFYYWRTRKSAEPSSLKEFRVTQTKCGNMFKFLVLVSFNAPSIKTEQQRSMSIQR